MVNVEEELRILEEAATSAYGAYKEQLDTKARLETENTDLEEELGAVRAKINSEQGDLGSFQEKMAKVSAQKADLEVQLAEFTETLAAEERMKANAGEEKRNMDREMGNIKQDLGDVQSKVNRIFHHGINFPGPKNAENKFRINFNCFIMIISKQLKFVLKGFSYSGNKDKLIEMDALKQNNQKYLNICIFIL